MTKQFDRLFFHSFFVHLERDLGIPPDVNKCEKFIELVRSYYKGLAQSDQLTRSQIGQIYRWAEYLFLPNYKASQRKKFQVIFLKCVRLECDLARSNTATANQTREPKVSSEPSWIAKEFRELIKRIRDILVPVISWFQGLFGKKPKRKEKDRIDDVSSTPKYVNIGLGHADTKKGQSTAGLQSRPMLQIQDQFLLKEGYHPIPPRKMVQIWRTLRQFEFHGRSNQLDIPATVKEWATSNMITEPVYKPVKSPKESSLLIFADHRGSMIPFHSLTETIIEAAITDGGHRRAEVFYFENLPVQQVYQGSKNMEAILLKYIFAMGNPKHTVALIISDAGAARGHLNHQRAQETGKFIKKLKKSVKQIAWLNPMPYDRWFGTTAELIGQQIDMFPILDSDETGFSQAIKLLVGKEIEGFPLI